MKNRNLILAIMTMMAATSAFAQGSSGAGNGGRVWVCFEPKDPKTGKRPLKSVELLDYVEARSLTKWQIDLGLDRPNVDDTQAMIDLALTRLTRVDAWRAGEVRKKLEEIKTRSVILDLNNKVALNKIDDATVLIMPPDDEDCVERQGAFNKTSPGPMDFKYAFIKQYLEKMSDLDRAGLMLHEAIYNLDASLGAKKSDGSREIVRAVSSPMLDGFTAQFYYELAIKNTNYPTVTAGGVSYRDASLADNFLIRGTLMENHIFPTAALCDSHHLDCAYAGIDSVRKTFALNVNGRVGDQLVFDFTGQTEGPGSVARGGRVIGPSITANLSDLSFVSDRVLQAESFQINQLLEGPEWSRAPLLVDNRILIDYPSLQPTNKRILLGSAGGLVTEVGPKGYTLTFNHKNSVHLDFQQITLGYRIYVTVAEDGHVSQLEMAPAYFSDGKVKLTDASGNVSENLLKDNHAFPNGHGRLYWVLGFDAEGSITHNELVKRHESED